MTWSAVTFWTEDILEQEVKLLYDDLRSSISKVCLRRIVEDQTSTDIFSEEIVRVIVLRRIEIKNDEIIRSGKRESRSVRQLSGSSFVGGSVLLPKAQHPSSQRCGHNASAATKAAFNSDSDTT